MATQIQLRRGTAAAWAAANPTLAQGEIGVETDTGLIKLGDGATAWTSLAYPVPKLAGDLGGTGAAPTVVATHLAAPLPEAQGGTGRGTGAAAIAGDLGGTNASPQVTATHLAAPLAQAQGGTGAASLTAAGAVAIGGDLGGTAAVPVVQLPAYTTATRPAASSSTVGRSIYVKDPGAAGQKQFCRQLADGSYEWAIEVW